MALGEILEAAERSMAMWQLCHKSNDGSDSRGYATIVSSGSCTRYGICLVHTIKVRLLRTEVMDTLLYGRVARNLGRGGTSLASKRHTKAFS